MKKSSPLTWIKRFLIGLTLILVIGATLVTLLFDANDYKDQIVKQVEKALPIKLELGDLNWRIFPWIGIKIGPSTIYTATTHNPQQVMLASIENISARMALMPLLSGNIQVDSVDLNAPQIHVSVTANGKTNWDALLTLSQPQPAPSPVTNEATPANAQIAINSFKLSEGVLHYQDQRSDTKVKVDRFNLSVQAPDLSKPLDTVVSFNLNTLGIKTQVQMQAAIDLTQRTVTVKTAKANALNTQMNVTGVIGDFTQTPEFELDLSLITDDINLALTTLDLIPTPMEKTVPLAAQAKISGDTQNIKIHVTTMQLDQTKGRANIQLSQINTQPKISITAHLDQINIDDYLQALSSTATVTQSKPHSGKQKSTQQTETAATTPIPVDTITALNLDLKLEIDSLILENITSEAITVAITAQNGQLKLSQFECNTLGGQVSVIGLLNVQARTPTLEITKSFKQLDMGSLARIYQDQSFFEGKLNLQANLTSQGYDTDQILDNISGKANMQMVEARLIGQSMLGFIYEQLDRMPLLKSLIKSDKITNLNKIKQRLGDDTYFNNLIAKAQLMPGEIQITQIQATADQAATLRGIGVLNIQTAQMSFDINMQLDEAISNPTLAEISWPFQCQGPLSEAPSCKMDTANVSQQVKKLAEEKAKNELKEKAKEKQDEAKSKLEDKLKEKFNQGLRGLFR